MSLIKGAIRKDTIAYSGRTHKTEEEKLRKLEREISNLEKYKQFRTMRFTNQKDHNNINVRNFR